MNNPKVADHAREISFAVFRVCSLVEQNVLRRNLESAAVKLTVQSVSRSEEALVSLEELDQLVRLAEVIGEIKPMNAKVLVRELSILKSEMIPKVETNLNEIDISGMFTRISSDVIDVAKSELPIEKAKTSTMDEVDKPKPTQIVKFNKPALLEPNQSATRQSAILAYIKDLPNGCRMKDLLQQFPSSSERTIRNDIQTLVASGSIERFGALQGPFSYYRFKNKSMSINSSEFRPLDGRGESLPKEVTKDQIIAL